MKRLTKNFLHQRIFMAGYDKYVLLSGFAVLTSYHEANWPTRAVLFGTD